MPKLSEVAGVDASLANTGLFFARGRAPAPFKLTFDPAVRSKAVDSATTQEGAISLAWSGAGTARIAGPTLDLTRETNAEVNIQLTYRVEKPVTGAVTLALGGTAVPLGSTLKPGGWQVLRVPLKCFRDAGAKVSAVSEPVAIAAGAPFSIAISDIRLATDPTGAVCPK